MSYRNNDSLGGVAILIVLGIIGVKFHPWSWLIIVGLFGFYIIFLTIRNSHDEKKLRLNLCKHGVIGAYNQIELCNECIKELNDEIEANKLRLEALHQREEQERITRENAHKEYVAKIRLPSFLREMDPYEFERLSCDLFNRIGYEAQPTSSAGDHGVDGKLMRNGELTILQVKRVKGYVGEPILRDLFGTMHSHNAISGIVVTTGKVSRQAREWVRDKPIRIIELAELVDLIRQHYPENEVVPKDFTLLVNDSLTCPNCYRSLKKIKTRYSYYFKCSGSPKCKFTRK